MKEFNNQQESVEFDLYTMTGRYYEKSCCGWRKEVGRSQLGGWHVSVGDEVKAAFKLLSVNLHTDTHSGTQTYGICAINEQKSTQTHIIYIVNRKAGKFLDRHTCTQREERTVVDVPTDAERRQIAPFEGKAKSNTECDFCHCGVWL